MPEPIDITGRKFGRLTVQAYIGTRRVGQQSKRFWRCRCDCGQVIERSYGALTVGNTRSCGCLLADTITKHGGYRSAVYKVWHAMLERCRNPSNEAYPEYGGRGISACERWQDFARFRDDMGPRPPGGTLERNDVDGRYSPENCRWASPLEQANNRRNNRRLTHKGETLTVAQWARRLGSSKSAILHRLSAGWTAAEALSTPFDRRLNGGRRRLLRAQQ